MRHSHPRRLTRTLLAAVAPLVLMTGCQAVDFTGVELVSTMAFPRKCQGSFDESLIKGGPGYYDIRAWEYENISYHLPVFARNVMFPTQDSLALRGEGNWRRVVSAEVRWKPPKGWPNVKLPSVSVPINVIMKPLDTLAVDLSLMNDQLWRTLEDVVYRRETDGGFGVDSCFTGTNPSPDAPDEPLQDFGIDPQKEVCRDLLTAFDVEIRLEMQTPDGKTQFSNALHYPIMVCRDCLFISKQLQEKAPKKDCCKSPWKVNTDAPTAWATTLAGLRDLGICYPFQDTMGMHRAYLLGGFRELSCDKCVCPGESVPAGDQSPTCE